MKTNTPRLPIPAFHQDGRSDQIWEPKFTEIEDAAELFARDHKIKPHNTDKVKVALVPIDIQNSFCNPNFELFVGGRSGRGALDDSDRTAKFIYQNLDVITNIIPTLDTHMLLQIFFRLCWVNNKGEHPTPNATLISLDDVMTGKWTPNPAVAAALFGGNVAALNQYFLHYVKELTDGGQYPLTIWNAHCMLGTIGHAMVSTVFEAIYFHNAARKLNPGFQIKGLVPYSEMYSPFGAEVTKTHDGKTFTQPNLELLDTLMTYDMVIFLGQAKSHCVAWAIDHLLKRIATKDPSLAQKVYFVEDCTSPVVIPGVIDFTDKADAAVARFKAAGMHVVTSDMPIVEWPGSPF